MAKIEIMMMLDFSVGSTIKHKLCAELAEVTGWVETDFDGWNVLRPTLLLTLSITLVTD